MNAAIIGLEQAGKTTLFGALTRQPVLLGQGGFGGENRVAVVEVPDRRVDRLVEMYRPRKETRATVQIVDGAPGAAGKRFGPEFLQEVRRSDALVAVVRAFDSPSVPEPEGGLDPLRDCRTLQAELILADMDLVEKRLERMIKEDRARPKGVQGGLEKETLLRVQSHLESELPVSSFEFTPSEEEAIRHLQFASRLPLVVVVNVGEDDLAAPSERSAALSEWAGRARTPVLEICASVELEVAQLEPSEEATFLEALGVEESGRTRLIRAVYELLGLISFFTVGQDEVRAWTVRQGDNAVTAAGKIHSDLARGFIRAEVIRYEHLVESGDEKAARAQGHYHLETKNYPVRDGDVLNIRFSV